MALCATADSYGVRSAQDQISGETVAIKLVTRLFEKIQLSKRALREISLLRHFANHENVRLGAVRWSRHN
jgi:mitogen-activated protein kinase 7